MDKENILQTVEALRGLSHGEIETLADGFSIKGNQPYSICVIPKDNIVDGVISIPDNAGLLVECKTLLNNDNKPLPAMFNDWTPASIVFIKPAAIDLDTYRVFFVAGTKLE